MARIASLVTSSQRRSGRPSAAASRLAFAEFLLACDDPAECAQRALEWLGEHADLRHGLCAAVDPEQGRLSGLAGRGLAPSEVSGFGLDLEDRDHPLVAALYAKQPILLPVGAEARKLLPPPLDQSTCLLLPLPLTPLAGKADLKAGLLALSGVFQSTSPELMWIADVLGRRLARLRSLLALAVTERRLAREKTLLYSVINAVPDPVLLTDTEGRMLLANQRAEMLFAAQERESEGRRRAIALNNMLLSAALSQQAMGGVQTRRELPLVNPEDGSDLLFELLSAVTRDAREGTGVVSILRNVTDLREATEEIEENYRKLRLAEQSARAERDRLDLIIDSVADPIVVTDPTGNIVMMNPPADRLFTVPKQAGVAAARAVRANDAHFTSFVSNVFLTDTGSRWLGECSLTDPVSLVASPVEAVAGKILSEHGEVIAVVTILHDRTEAIEKAELYEQLKRASEELEEKVGQATAELLRQNELLQRQHVELEQASALKSQFLANMSHEFRTPLNAILGYTNMLLQGVSGAMSQQQKRSLLRIDSNSQHLLSIINDILDISRIEAGKMPLHVDEFAARDLLAEVMAEVEPIIARAKLPVATELEPKLPKVLSDRQKVKQIVQNLLTNALKFTQNGGVRVRASYDPKTDQVAIAVADSGIGIARHDQAKIFDDFRQADNSPTREYGGAGLGLSICRRLATMLGGRIKLTSELGRGSTFTLCLPRRLRRK